VNSTDVFVIGGGPAGLAAAIAARQQGARVTVADGAQPPIDKPCGEGLMPDGVTALEKLGITFKPEECHPFEGVRFFADGVAADASFPSNCGLGVRRTTLHRVMIERAASMGVDFLWRTPVTGISPNEVSLGERTVSAKWIIGADGAKSRVRRWARLDRVRKKNSRFAFRQHYRVAPWTNRMEIYWGQLSHIYVAPVTAEEMCVVLVSRDSWLRLEEALPTFPELQSRLGQAEIVSSERGTITATCNLERVSGNNVALIGDASGTVDAITKSQTEIVVSPKA